MSCSVFYLLLVHLFWLSFCFLARFSFSCSIISSDWPRFFGSLFLVSAIWNLVNPSLFFFAGLQIGGEDGWACFYYLVELAPFPATSYRLLLLLKVCLCPPSFFVLAIYSHVHIYVCDRGSWSEFLFLPSLFLLCPLIRNSAGRYCHSRISRCSTGPHFYDRLCYTLNEGCSSVVDQCLWEGYIRYWYNDTQLSSVFEKKSYWLFRWHKSHQ